MMHKTIHYCWFGGNPKSELILKCMESWKKVCPDFEIVEWNESNFDVSCCRYVKEAYEAKKWAFVSDYARFWILYHFGGIYVDTDVELIKPLEDLPDTFVGFEDKHTVASGLIRGACKGDSFCKQMLDSYEKDSFLLEDGSINKTTVCMRETALLKEQGLIPNGTLQQIGETTVYPSEYFSPKNYITGEMKLTSNTVSIHHYDSSWYSEEDKYAIALRTKYSKFMPQKLALRLSKLMAIKHFRGWRVAIAEGFRFLRRKKR